nr:receptor-transporting protein 3 [Cavia porcellus]
MAATDQDMEEWEQVFQELIREVKPWHKWTLETDTDLLPDVLQQGWSQYQQRTFARFRCSSCFRTWASAHVQVLFHVHWSGKQGRGQVKMRVFSQSCKRCLLTRFEVPEFTLENIRRVLTNLVFRILKKCYREGFKQMEELHAVKDVNLEGPHDSLHCEACLQGFCAQVGGRLASKPSVPPSLSTLSKDTGMSRVTTADGHHPCSPPPKMDKLLVSAVTPKDQNPPKAESKVSHAPKPSAAPRHPTKEVTPTLTVTPKVPNLVKTGSKVNHTPKSAVPKYSTEDVTPILITTPEVPNLAKTGSKVNHTPKSAVPKYSIEDVTPILIATPKVPCLAKTEFKVSHIPKPLAAPRHPTENVMPTLIGTPKVHSLPSTEDKVYTWLAAQESPPIDSRTTAGVAWDTRVTTGEIRPSPPAPRPARSTWDRGCSSWDQRGRATSSVDSRVLMPPIYSESPDCRCRPPCCGCSGCCCLLLILVGLVVAFTVPWGVTA